MTLSPVERAEGYSSIPGASVLLIASHCFVLFGVTNTKSHVLNTVLFDRVLFKFPLHSYSILL